MTYVVSEACIGCTYTDCVLVCPVDCFCAGQNFLVIDPEECINCGLCEVECPVEAIHNEADLKAENLHWLDLNAELAKSWPRISKKREPPPDAEEWRNVENKIHYLIR